MGNVGRFAAADASRYPRGARVIVRTSRGLELGEILAPPGDGPDAGAEDGKILRGMTDSDELLSARMEKYRQEAFQACQQALDDRGLATTLLEVEHLFDGRGLYFYFLGEVTPEIEQLTSELADVYDAQSQFRRFAEALTEGCGPDCGTDEGGGNCDSCSTCAVAVACGRSG